MTERINDTANLLPETLDKPPSQPVRRSRIARMRPGLWAVWLTFMVAGGGVARAQDNAFCQKCHARDPELRGKRGDREVSLYVDPERFAKSVHADLDCVTCHQDLADTELPHSYDLEPVNCADCHSDAEDEYLESIHGEKLDEGDPLAPRCQECHGNHYILPLSNPDSAVAPFNIPQMCAQCHAEDAPVARAYDIPQEQILKRYSQSIHGEGLFKQGLSVTAVCTSCHTGHHVLPHDDPESSISAQNVSATCMKCHGRIQDVHRKIIRGALWQQEGKIPNCVGCHSPHEVRRAQYDTRLANADCLSCHKDPDIKASDDGRSLFVDSAEFSRSIHGRKLVACTQCHTGVDPRKVRACETITEKVDCAVCHEAQVAAYSSSVHGKLFAKGDFNAPSCTDCHGRHNTLEHEPEENAPANIKAMVRESTTFVLNIPRLCGKCHREGGKAAVRYLGPQKDILKNYSMSIHGKGLLESGLTVTATCTDCHTSHHELPANDPNSSVHPDNIAATCGNCHDGIYEQYASSIHSPTANTGYEQLRGMPALPRCADCHASHTVTRTDVSEFRQNIMQQCGKCHTELAESYFDTYHGKASRLVGGNKAAMCYDCHGAHDILPPDNPKSHLSRANIVSTCAKCHPGSHRQFAGYLTHATHHDPDRYPVLYYAFWGMTVLLISTFGFFGLHTLIWLPRSWKARRELREIEAKQQEIAGKQYVRFKPVVRVMHAVMILSFFGLATTGMMLKFSYTGWAVTISALLGGFEAAGLIHRICAVTMLALFVYHIVDVWKRYRASGHTMRRFFFGPDTILFKWRDIGEFGATLKWFMGKGPRPRYGRWAYWEKFDYFAVFWGIAIIGSTGLFLWFPEIFTYVLPGWLINVATIIHSDEALLATGFIFTIHFFNANFRPEKFPMDTVIFTGQMPLAELQHERPEEYRELMESGQLESRLAKPPSRHIVRVYKVFGAAALLIGLTLVVLIIVAMLRVYR